MGHDDDRLERGILTLFKQARGEGRPAVAEHLLRALETIDADRPASTPTGSRPALAEALRTIAEDSGSDRTTGR